MKHLIALCLCSLFAPQLRAQSVTVIKFNQLEALLARDNDTTYVYNFFATWCDPCKKELPAFQKWDAEIAGKKVKLLFISLDFKNQLTKTLIPFLKKRNVKNDVYLLDETDYDTWINKIDSAWSGNLPMTLVVNSRKHIRRAFPQEFSLSELQQTLAPLIP